MANRRKSTSVINELLRKLCRSLRWLTFWGQYADTDSVVQGLNIDSQHRKLALSGLSSFAIPLHLPWRFENGPTPSLLVSDLRNACRDDRHRSNTVISATADVWLRPSPVQGIALSPRRSVARWPGYYRYRRSLSTKNVLHGRGKRRSISNDRRRHNLGSDN